MPKNLKPERVGPVRAALLKNGAQWFRDGELPPGYRAEIDTTPLRARVGEAVPGCPHLPACTGYCPSVETRFVVDRANPQPEVQTDLSSRGDTPQDFTPRPPLRTRGTTNRNARGSSEERRRRRVWLVATWRADVDVKPWESTDVLVPVPLGEGWPACRCYRCGVLLTEETVSADRIIPGCRGGTYRRDNIRPACQRCQSVVGGGTRRVGK